MQEDSQKTTGITDQLIHDLILEKRSARRWKNIRFFIGLMVFLLIIAGMVFEAGSAPLAGDSANGYVSLVRLEGMIAPGQDFSARTVLPILEDAFSDSKSKGVILDINSGGGTPVQAAIIHDAILDLKKRHHKKVVVVGEDTMASGAYFVAVAADRIYVNPSSLTGSVGVIMKDFGFPVLLQKIGVERRVYTSGVNKDRLDPFLPQSPEDVEKIRQVIGEVHDNFKAAVEAGRKGMLKGDTDTLFSGDFWAGNTAVRLGLVDKLGNLSDAMRDEFHVSAYRDYSAQPSFFRNVMGQMGNSLGLSPVSGSSLGLVEKI